MFNLPSIARSTEGLGVIAHGFSSCGHANDVIQLKSIRSPTSFAGCAKPRTELRGIEADAANDSRALPFGQLHDFGIMGRKTPSRSVAVRPLAINFRSANRHSDNLRGSCGTVAFPRAKSDALPGSIAPLLTGRPSLKKRAAHLASVADFTSFAECRNKTAFTSGSETLHSAESNLSAFCFGGAVESGRSLKRNVTNFTDGSNFHASLWHVFPFSDFPGEFGETQRQYSVCKNYTIPSMLAIPSQATYVAASAVRDVEGVTTRSEAKAVMDPRAPGATAISEEIVWTTARYLAQAVEAYHKQMRANILTYKRYSGYDILNISPSDVFTAAQYPFAQAAAAVSISGLEMLQNSGKEKMIDLLESRIKNAERTMMNNLSNDCYSNGTADGGKQIGGLQLLVSDVANSGTVGGIDRSVWGFWQPNSQSFATNGLTPGAATMQTMMNRTWLAQARQADKPDLIISDNVYFRYYWESLQAIQRIGEDNSGMAGFMSLKFMNADVVYDGGFQGNATGNVSVLGNGGSWLSGSGAPASHMYFLNTDYIFLRPHKDRDMVPLDPDRFSVNQDAMVKLVAWAGNMTMSNAFLQGVIIS